MGYLNHFSVNDVYRKHVHYNNRCIVVVSLFACLLVRFACLFAHLFVFADDSEQKLLDVNKGCSRIWWKGTQKTEHSANARKPVSSTPNALLLTGNRAIRTEKLAGF